MQIKVIGLGGIGSCLVPILARFLNYHVGAKDESVELTLIDGDDYEERNRERQEFHRPGNKAEVMAERLRKELANLRLRAKPEYVTGDNVVRLIRDGDVVLLCPDNHATRKLLSDRFEELENGLLISGGNELTTGNVQIYIRKSGRDVTLPIANRFHPEIQNPNDRNPGEGACRARVASEPQILVMNNAVADRMLVALYAYLRGRLNWDEEYLDILSGNHRKVYRVKPKS